MKFRGILKSNRVLPTYSIQPPIISTVFLCDWYHIGYRGIYGGIIGGSFMNISDLIERYSYSKNLIPNKLKIPLNIIPMTDDGMEEFNSIIDYIHSLNISQTPLSSSGGISTRNYEYINSYRVIDHKSSVEIIFLYGEYNFRWEFRRDYKKDSDGISGRAAFTQFKNVCKQFNIDIDSFRVSSDDGKKIKMTIPSAILDVDPKILDYTYENIHHIDIHSAYMAGIADSFPLLREPIEYIYNRRKEPGKSTTYKAILTHSFGYMQSEYSPVYYQLSHLSKSAMIWCRNQIIDLTKRLNQSGRKVLMRNTDGIWYQGNIYHGDGEGKGLGQWENDHINCQYRAKSVGCYEYIENGIYTPVARGKYELDKVKPRDKWEWGDIYYTGQAIEYYFNSDTQKLERNGEFDEI